MQKLVYAISFALLILAGCATQQSVMPDLRISREIPTDVALAWLKKVAAPEPHIGGGIPACQYNDQGIFARDGKSTVTWTGLRTSPQTGGISHTVGSYQVLVVKTPNEVTGIVTVSRKDIRDSAGLAFPNHRDECSAFYVRRSHASESKMNKATRTLSQWAALDEARITEVKQNVERTLSALAALGVVIERQPPQGAQQ